MIMQRLRTETQPQHKHLGQHPITSSLIMGQATLASYRALMARFYGFYAPLEEQMRRSAAESSVATELPLRAKTPLLAQDLVALGISTAAQATIPLCSDLPNIPTPAHVLGCMYVLEGATLGGQLMARAAQQHLGISVASGGAFFFSYGPDLGHMWKSFGTLVQDYATSDPIANTIVAAACDTFETLDRWLNADGWVYLEVQGGQTPVLEQV